MIALHSIQAKIIGENELEWCIYSIEKRLTTFVTSSFFLGFAIMLTNPWIAISYLGSFIFLRARTNGFHAKTYLGCFFASIVSEFIFLHFLLPVVTPKLVCILNALNIFIILLFAPVNSSSIHMTQGELYQAKKYVCNRLILLITILVLCRDKTAVLQGLTLGNTMASLFLVIEIIKGGISNAHQKRKSHCKVSHSCTDHP